MKGHMGKILHVNLSRRRIETIPTEKYEQWIGGHGMGSAIFFDLVKDKTIDGFDPSNVVTIMTSPLSGTLVPACAGRTEVQGIGVQSYPIGWFTRSNFGGRFSTWLKQAGWDGIVIEGKADQPVWIDIRDDDVKIVDCSDLSLWGTDTRTCQERIWEHVAGKNVAKTAQPPAVLAIGQAGENLSRMACLMHDAGNSSGQGGFGAVWGAKQLKAISVLGTSPIVVHDAKGLMKARIDQMQSAFDVDSGKNPSRTSHFGTPPRPMALWGRQLGGGRPLEDQRPQACVGCHSGCRGRYKSGLGNEASCAGTIFYPEAHSLDIQRYASDLLNQYGINAYEMAFGARYLLALNRKGVLGPGKTIDFPMGFENYGSKAFLEQYLKIMAYGDDGKGNPHQTGKDLLQGFIRSAEKWGRLDGPEGDLKTGLLDFPYWGYPNHYEARTELEWGYGSILGDRDINEHGFNSIFWSVVVATMTGTQPYATAEETVNIFTSKMVPYQDDVLMMDYSDENMYSEHMAKLVAWHRNYSRFWKQSVLFCDLRWPDFLDPNVPGKVGTTGESEPRFFNAVTGENLTFLNGIELGRKIWNLDQAIWTLQGRHRDMVQFADYIYSVPYDRPGCMPGRKNGKWVYLMDRGRTINRKGFEEFKTHFYTLEGWDPASGYPTRKTLEEMDLKYVADELEMHSKLGGGVA